MFYYDAEINPWIIKFDEWLVTNNFPSFYLTFPKFKEFFNSESYNEFRAVLGYGLAYTYPKYLEG